MTNIQLPFCLLTHQTIPWNNPTIQNLECNPENGKSSEPCWKVRTHRRSSKCNYIFEKTCSSKAITHMCNTIIVQEKMCECVHALLLGFRMLDEILSMRLATAWRPLLNTQRWWDFPFWLPTVSCSVIAFNRVHDWLALPPLQLSLPMSPPPPSPMLWKANKNVNYVESTPTWIK